MNAVPNIERIDSGPAYMDRASEQYGDTESERTEREIRTGFAMAAGKADANALCTWAPRTTDWDAAKRMPIDQRTTEVMVESLDYGNGPTMTEAMQLILNATRSTDTDLALLAGDLVDRMGAAFARMNS
jgi:hypothetical protein